MLRLVPVLLAIALLAPSFAAPPARAAAVTFQADPAHTGNAGEAGLRLPLRRAWALRLPGRVSYPVIAGGRAFVVRARPRLKGSEVVAVALGTGRVLWRRDLGVEADSADLAYGEGRVVVARESYYDPGDPSAVLALAAADGRLLWEFGTGLFDGRPPVVAGGAVYLHGLHGTGVTALRLADGALLWTARTDSGDSGSPAVAGDAVFAAVSGCPDVHRFRHSDGAEIWHRENGCHGGGGSTAVLFGDRLYVLESRRYPPGDVYDVTSGAIVGRMRADIPPVFAGRIGVFPDARRPRESSALYGHTLVARDLDSGRVRWMFRGDGYLDGAPLIAGRTVFVGSGSGRIYGVSLRRGRVVWRGSAGAPVPFPTPGGTVSGLAAAEGTLLVPALGRLVAYR